jgi:hypothetical protein
MTLDSALQGNSKSYTLARLKADHEELFARVAKGELTAHAAAIAAGFRKRQPTIKQLRALLCDDCRAKLDAFK